MTSTAHKKEKHLEVYTSSGNAQALSTDIATKHLAAMHDSTFKRRVLEAIGHTVSHICKPILVNPSCHVPTFRILL